MVVSCCCSRLSAASGATWRRPALVAAALVSTREPTRRTLQTRLHSILLNDSSPCKEANATNTNGETRQYNSHQHRQRSLRFEDTPLGRNGTHLLDGLDIYSVPAWGDEHPLAVYGIQSRSSTTSTEAANYQQQHRPPILLLHGRTWSSVPVYHLMGGPKLAADGQESRSLMEALLAQGLQPYCMDFRGFGGTPRDASRQVAPLRCVYDAETVLAWIAERHNKNKNNNEKNGMETVVPALLGWSQGAMVAQLLAQKNCSAISKLVLYGSIYDPTVRYAREPLYQMNRPDRRTDIVNEFDDAIEDFTVEGTIPPEPARFFAQAALITDPIKAAWKHLYEFNNCDPARVHVPTLVVAGDQDPYAPLHVQQELFANLGRGSDRTWSILADSDHAVHMLEGRARLINTIASFVLNSKRSEYRSQPF